LKHPELFAGGIRRRSGVLLYGPPGTGKTLLAKAVATECSVNFLSVKGPELINMYVGESERLVRDVFIRARRAKPCVIFFDELDSLAPARGRGSDSGGIMDRVVSQLLAEIDSAQAGSGNDDVFIIGATNRPDLLDPALLRPGRLDKLLYVGIASQSEDREKVLRALTRKFSLQNDVDFANIAKQCPPLLTGADMYGLCSRAWMTAFKRKVKQDPSDNSNTGVQVQHSDFIECLGTLTPSLTQEDVSRYESIKNEYK
jgi:peroxin-6